MITPEFPDLVKEKVDLYNKLTYELKLVEDEHDVTRRIIKSNHKYIRELRDDISRWKETCTRQSDRIYIYRLILGMLVICNLGTIAALTYALYSLHKYDC